MITGCLRTVVALAVIAGVLVVGWLNRDQIERVWRSVRVEVDAPASDSAVSPEAAQRAQDKLTALETGRDDRVALGEDELQSLIQYRYSQMLPIFTDTPRITLEDSVIRLRARLPVDKLPRVNELGQIAALLPDTTEIAVTGAVLPLGRGRVALAVEQMSAADIPLPRQMVPAVLRQLGRKDQPGVPDNAVGVPLPPGAGGAYIERDSLVLLARPIRHPAN
ncbi:MAG: hypothetical protein ACREM1_23215 [Longimicrobiales bacterium]